MILFENADYKEINNVSNDTLFICAIGYERRSYYLLDKNYSEFNSKNALIFVFDDYINYPHTIDKVEKIQSLGFTTKIVNYDCYDEILNEIIQFIKDNTLDNNSLNIHIDYSSMPRSWYCRIPLKIYENLRKRDNVYFWYAEGQYPDSYERFPSAGIDNFSIYSGKPSLKANNNRIHILGLGYDYIRSQAISTVVDPSFLIACYAFPLFRRDIQDNIKQVNMQLLSQAAFTLALHLDDFSFMISKLCETANELLIKGDVIFIPDGPKPLILAISLVTEILKKEGITCMHISRHSSHYSPVDVKPTESIYGFTFRGEIG